MGARSTVLCAASIACIFLAACAPSTKVAVAVNAPSQYSHVYLTVAQIWFNKDSAAGPDDATWLKFPLSEPVTIDLAANSNDAVAQLTSNLDLTPGTYAQVRLMPLDSTNALSASASKLGAIYNSEVDYTDTTGATKQFPLELVNPEKGIGLAGTIKIPKGELPGDSSASTFSLGLAFDTARDLVMLNDGSGAKVLLNPHGSVYDLSLSGAITGNVGISTLSGVKVTNGRSDVQVTAETLSADGTRYIPVLSVPVRSDGSFTLYPLATDPTTPSTYELVIHGPAVATVIIRNVPVNAGSATASTTTSIGSVAPRAATSYSVNVTPTGDATLPAGAVVRFHQTLPAAGEVPYCIEQHPIDPFTRIFADDLSISADTIDTGVFVSSGAAIALTEQTPLEGPGVYQVAGAAPLFEDGSLGTTVAPAPSNGTDAVTVIAPSLSVASEAVSASVEVAVTQPLSRPFNRGELLLSRDGAIVGTVALDGQLQQTTASPVARLDQLPGGTVDATFESGLYYMSVRAWNASSPSTTLTRSTYISPVDLRQSDAGTFSVPIG